MQLTPRAKRVIDLAFEEARQLKENAIGTEHLLLGLIGEGEGLAARVLHRLGIELEQAREETWRFKAKSGNKEKQEAQASVLTEVGVLGELRPQGDRDLVEAVWTEEAMIDLAGIFRARDGVGYEELLQTGDMTLLSASTEAKLLHKGSGIGGVLVRLRSGEHKGKSAWVFPESFVATREDDALFPPKVKSKNEG